MADFSSPALTFNFSTQSLRVIMRDDAPWFVAADVCEALDIANSRDAVSRLDDDEAGVATIDTRSSNGVVQAREVSIINESGLYSLIMTSRKLEARKFKKWVTSEVLPSIRKTGGYAKGNLSDFQEHTQRVEREVQITAAAKLFTSTHKSLCGLGLSRTAHASRANQLVQQATGVDYLGLAGNPHLPGNLELFEVEPEPYTRRPALTPVEKLLACLANGKRYKTQPGLNLIPDTEATHSELLRHTRMKRDEFHAAVAQAITQNLITRKYIPNFGGTIYALIGGAK